MMKRNQSSRTGRWKSRNFFLSLFGVGTEKDQATKIFLLRSLLVGSLFVAAAVCSTLCYLLLRGNETNLFKSQYESISDSAATSVVNSFIRLNLGLQEFSSSIGNTFPDLEAWPNVTVPGFYATAPLLGKLATLNNFGFFPKIRPDQLSGYEGFIAKYYASHPEAKKTIVFPGFNLGTVWELDHSTLIPKPDTTGVSPYSSKIYLAPTAQNTYSDEIGPQYLGYNLHSDPRFGPAMDRVVDCVAAHNFSVGAASCGEITEAVTLPFVTYQNWNPTVTDVTALLTLPIFPANNVSELVGFAAGSVAWSAVLTGCYCCCLLFYQYAQ